MSIHRSVPKDVHAAIIDRLIELQTHRSGIITTIVVREGCSKQSPRNRGGHSSVRCGESLTPRGGVTPGILVI